MKLFPCTATAVTVTVGPGKDVIVLVGATQTLMDTTVRGLLGAVDGNVVDDLVNPDGGKFNGDTNGETLFNDFGQRCMYEANCYCTWWEPYSVYYRALAMYSNRLLIL